MSAPATPITSPVKSAGPSRRLLAGELPLRFALVAAAVCVCYLFEWHWLRWLTAEFNSRLDLLAGVHLQRISYDTVAYNGKVYKYVIACTFADVWCGAIPLLWSLRASVSRNLYLIAIFTVGLFAFNVVRLSISDVLFAAGLSWDLAHNVLSGVAYYLIWRWIWARRPWGQADADRVMATSPAAS